MTWTIQRMHAWHAHGWNQYWVHGVKEAWEYVHTSAARRKVKLPYSCASVVARFSRASVWPTQSRAPREKGMKRCGARPFTCGAPGRSSAPACLGYTHACFTAFHSKHAASQPVNACPQQCELPF